MKKKAKIVNGVAIDAKFVEQGSSIGDQGREISWPAGTRLYIVVEGDRVVTKFRVDDQAEQKLAKILDEMPFGAYISVYLNPDNLVTDIKLLTV